VAPSAEWPVDRHPGIRPQPPKIAMATREQDNRAKGDLRARAGRRVHITATGQTGGEGTARVKTYADVLAEYRVHPEPKGLGPDGLPCGRQTRGLLSRRPVTAAYITYIGKESNRLDDRAAGLIHDSEEVLNEYPDPRRDPFRTLVLPVLWDCPTAMIAERVELDPTALRRIRAGRSVPRPAHKATLLAFRV